MADVADSNEVVNTEETPTIESLKELVKEADSEAVVSSENLENEEDTTTTEDLSEQNGSSEHKPTENGTAKDSTNGNGNGTSEAVADTVEENGSADLKRKSDVGVVESTDDADGVLPEKKAKLEEISDAKVEEGVEVSSNGDSELVV